MGERSLGVVTPFRALGWDLKLLLRSGLSPGLVLPSVPSAGPSCRAGPQSPPCTHSRNRGAAVAHSDGSGPAALPWSHLSIRKGGFLTPCTSQSFSSNTVKLEEPLVNNWGTVQAHPPFLRGNARLSS